MATTKTAKCNNFFVFTVDECGEINNHEVVYSKLETDGWDNVVEIMLPKPTATKTKVKQVSFI